VGDPETLLIDSTLLEVLHPRQVSQSAGWGNASAGAAWVRWGSFSVYGVKLHLLCATSCWLRRNWERKWPVECLEILPTAAKS
jgi:hypothetical protein